MTKIMFDYANASKFETFDNVETSPRYVTIRMAEALLRKYISRFTGIKEQNLDKNLFADVTKRLKEQLTIAKKTPDAQVYVIFDRAKNDQNVSLRTGNPKYHVRVGVMSHTEYVISTPHHVQGIPLLLPEPIELPVTVPNIVILDEVDFDLRMSQKIADQDEELARLHQLVKQTVNTIYGMHHPTNESGKVHPSHQRYFHSPWDGPIREVRMHDSFNRFAPRADSQKDPVRLQGHTFDFPLTPDHFKNRCVTDITNARDERFLYAKISNAVHELIQAVFKQQTWTPSLAHKVTENILTDVNRWLEKYSGQNCYVGFRFVQTSEHLYLHHFLVYGEVTTTTAFVQEYMSASDPSILPNISSDFLGDLLKKVFIIRCI